MGHAEVGIKRYGGPGRPGWGAADARESADGRLPEGGSVRQKMEEFNRAYCGLLRYLCRSVNADPGILGDLFGAMMGIRDLAEELMRMPIGDGQTTVGPSLEYVAPAQLVPARAAKHFQARGAVAWPPPNVAQACVYARPRRARSPAEVNKTTWGRLTVTPPVSGRRGGRPGRNARVPRSRFGDPEISSAGTEEGPGKLPGPSGSGAESLFLTSAPGAASG